MTKKTDNRKILLLTGHHPTKFKVSKSLTNWAYLHGHPGVINLVEDAIVSSMSVCVCSDEEGWRCGLQPAPLKRQAEGHN